MISACGGHSIWYATAKGRCAHRHIGLLNHEDIGAFVSQRVHIVDGVRKVYRVPVKRALHNQNIKCQQQSQFEANENIDHSEWNVFEMILMIVNKFQVKNSVAITIVDFLASSTLASP